MVLKYKDPSIILRSGSESNGTNDGAVKRYTT